MSLLASPATCNPHIHYVQAELKRRGCSVECLVFADNDPMLVSRLAEAMDAMEALIVPADQARWQDQAESLSEAATWAVLDAGVDWLVLVGNSTTQHELSPASQLVRTTVKRSAEDIVREANERSKRGERRYAAQVHALLSVPEISERLAAGTLRFHGLYHRAETGVFAAYNPADGSFRPLVD